MFSIKLPKRLETKLVSTDNNDFANKVNSFVDNYIELSNDEMLFFPEYTDHGIGHIERVLIIIDKLIPQCSYEKMTSEDVGVLIIAVILHDIGMHTNIDLFNNMINGEYDKTCMKEFGDKTWKKLWEEFVFESNYWNKEKKENILGEEPRLDVLVKIPDSNDPQKTKTINRKFIGEFIRRHHHRLAHDIALNGYKGYQTLLCNIEGEDDYFLEYLNLAGLVARSHGIDMRDTFEYLKKIKQCTWSKPINTNIFYLMSLLRIADYLDITKNRTNKVKQKVKKMYSPFSRLEHTVHNAIWTIHYGDSMDKELITIEVVFPKKDEENVKTYAKIKNLVNGIQNELDKSSAVLGEVYGIEFTLQFRRIKTNVTDKSFESDFHCIPKLFKIRLNDDIAKLLIKPLYSDNPSFGVRELVQNAVDACRECMNSVTNEDEPHVDVKLDTEKKLFTIADTGKGMTIEEIEKYFLTIGSSYNDDINWKRLSNNKEIYRSGRFGIGVLASFLLGDKIVVETKSRKGESGYRFELSIDNKFVEISKVDNLNYGTKIEIKCKESSLRELLLDCNHNHRNSAFYPKVKQWFNWYIDSKPIVRYYTDGIEIVSDKTDLKGFKELIYEPKEFGAIRYKTNNLFKYKSPNIFASRSTPFLYCNGFYVTFESNKHDFFLTHIKGYYPFGIPSLQITDPQNILPLDLNRTNIDGNTQYDFEEDLAIEVCKNLICQLISINDTRILALDNISRFIYLGYDGFAFNNNYTNKKLANKSLIYLPNNSLWIKDFFDVDGLDEWYHNYDNNHKCIFSFIALNDINTPLKIYGYNDREAGDYAYHLTSDNKKSYTYRGYCIKSTSSMEHEILLNKFIDFMNKKSINFSFVGISEINIIDSLNSLNDKEKRVIKKLINVYNEYLQENPFIPYKVDERKNRFKKIFNDESLSQQVEYYLEENNPHAFLSRYTFE